MIVAIGSFDGYHRGHQALFAEAERMAEKLCCPWMPLTFHPHPATFTGQAEVKFLFTEQEKLMIRRFLNIPSPWILPFDERLRSLEATEFLTELHWRQRLSGIAVGEDFRFGKGRHGTIDVLQRWCSQQGLDFSAVPSLLDSSRQVISSTRIRRFITEGRIEEATKLLGHPWFFSGTVVPGEKRGRKLGFPTANISTPAEKIMATEGVYAAITLRENTWVPVALSIGRNPTFTFSGPVTIEAHLVQDYEDLYGQVLTVWLLQKLRPMKHFANAENLVLQISEDTRQSTCITERFSTTAIAEQLQHFLTHVTIDPVCDNH